MENTPNRQKLKFNSVVPATEIANKKGIIRFVAIHGNISETGKTLSATRLFFVDIESCCILV